MQRLAKDVGLCDGDHVERRLHARGNAPLFDGVHHGERVDDGREHAHLVGGGAVHIGALPAPPEVAPADDERDLHAHIVYFDELIDDARDDLFVETELLIARKRFARELQQDPFVFRLHSIPFAPHGAPIFNSISYRTQIARGFHESTAKTPQKTDARENSRARRSLSAPSGRFFAAAQKSEKMMSAQRSMPIVPLSRQMS